jgi:hypothetical protein
MERLDEERLETLRSWGSGLEAEERPEVRAAGRAILLLLDEIELLHMDLWHARASVEGEPVEGEPVAAAPEPGDESTLRARLRRLTGGERTAQQPAG